jgi:acetolactate synthase-1/2/3 large subunit
MPADHPLWLGSIGRNGTFPANQATRSADVLLALGVRFDDRESSAWIPGYTFQIPPTRLIQVDVDDQELARNYPVHLGVQADPKMFLQQLLGWLERDSERDEQWAWVDRSSWLSQVAAWKREWQSYMQERYRPEARPISAQHLLRSLRRALPRDGILAVDVGIHHNWVVQLWESYSPQTILQSWGFAAMGFGAAGVLGAKLAAPERPAVALCGDGGFLMVSHVVATAVEYGIPVTWVVWNNFGYVSIRDLQRGAFGRELSTMFVRQESGEIYSPDFALLARAYGAQGVRVESPGELEDVLEAALRSDRPTVVDVLIDMEDAPVAVGTWQLPPLPHPEPNYPGARRA